MEGSSIVRKGAWSKEEDDLLRECIQRYGQGKWHLVPSRAGLNRCRKSCRLRWLNYLKPDIKRGEFADDEVDLIVRLHKLLGNRWSLIAGRIPGRTANDVKNYWHTHIRKHHNIASSSKIKDDEKQKTQSKVIKPRPRTLTKTLINPNGNTETTHIQAAGNLNWSPRQAENIKWETWPNDMEGDHEQQIMNVDSSWLSAHETSLGVEIDTNWSDLISFDDDLLNLLSMDP